MKTFYIAGPKPGSEEAGSKVQTIAEGEALFYGLTKTFIPAFDDLEDLRDAARPGLEPGVTTIYKITVEDTNEELVRVN